MHVTIIGPVREPVTFARGVGVRDLARLKREHGPGNWRKRKGFATVAYPNGYVTEAEIHWYEANGIGKREIKIKREIP